MTNMEESPSLMPVPNPTPSYWRSELHHLDSHRSTPDLPETSDVVIIGAGMAGVSVAYHLAQTPHPPATLLLEARQTCSGATGRNGGHIKVMTATLLALLRTKPSPSSTPTQGPKGRANVDAANEIARFTQAHIDALKHVVETERLDDCEFELRRSFDVFTAARDAAAMAAAFDTCRARGDAWTRDRTWIGPEFAERLTSVRGCKGAFSVPACSLWPYKFVTGLLERAMTRVNHGRRRSSSNDDDDDDDGDDAGSLNLQTETPVTSVEELDDGSTIVRTARGAVRASKVVFATNAYTGALLPAYRGVITPYKGTAAHLAARDGRAPVYPHLSHTYNLEFGLQPGKSTRDYLNPRPDGGIVVGGGKWIFEKREEWDNTVDDATLYDSVTRSGYFEGYMQRNFRGWEDSGAEPEKVWTGIMGATPDGYPHIGKVPGKQAQWILAGFNGGGMPMIFLSAKGVAKMVMEDVPFGESDAGIPLRCETTAERLRG